MLAGTMPSPRASYRPGGLPAGLPQTRRLSVRYGAVTVTSVPKVRYGQIRFAGPHGSSTQPRLSCVEVRDPGDRVRVLGSVRVGALHDLTLVPDVHRVGPDRRWRDRYAGIRRVPEDLDAVVPDGQGLGSPLARQRVGVAVLVRLVACYRAEQRSPKAAADRPVQSQPFLVLIDHVRRQPVIGLERHHRAPEYLARLVRAP